MNRPLLRTYILAHALVLTVVAFAMSHSRDGNPKVAVALVPTFLTAAAMWTSFAICLLTDLSHKGKVR